MRSVFQGYRSGADDGAPEPSEGDTLSSASAESISMRKTYYSLMAEHSKVQAALHALEEEHSACRGRTLFQEAELANALRALQMTETTLSEERRKHAARMTAVSPDAALASEARAVAAEAQLREFKTREAVALSRCEAAEALVRETKAREVAALQRLEVSTAAEASNIKLKKDLEEALHSLSTTKAEAEGSRASSAASAEEAASVRKALAASAEEAASIKKALATAEGDIAKARQAISTLEEQASRLQQALAAAEEERANLARELAAAQSKQNSSVPAPAVVAAAPPTTAWARVDALKAELRKIGLESSELQVYIDCTLSNQTSGKVSFEGRSLHDISNPSSPNPYQQVITVLAKSLQEFDDDGLIPVFGFGDMHTVDREVFPFHKSEREYCKGAEGVLAAYQAKIPTLRLQGPTSFAPAINKTISILKSVKKRSFTVCLIIADGQVTNPAETIKAILAASSLPISIVCVGVGDGPWEEMRKFDESLPTRKFDNFCFVEWNEIREKALAAGGDVNSELALAVFEELPQQVLDCKKLKLM